MFQRVFRKHQDQLPKEASFPIFCGDREPPVPFLGWSAFDGRSNRLLPFVAYEHWIEVVENPPFDDFYHNVDGALADFDIKGDKMFWRGRVATYSRLRMRFMQMFNSSTLFDVSHVSNNTAENYVDLYDTCQHKYLIDLPGAGFSGRRGYLLLCGSVLFVVDWPHKEWASHLFLPWVDFVPVKADMSDLLENFDTVRNNQTLALEIATNCNSKARKLFAQERRDEMTAAALANFWDEHGSLIGDGDL